jgi:hypothetical protein
MQTRITLDRTALDALFPVGSEARVGLAKAAYQAVLREAAGPGALGHEVKCQIDYAIRQSRDEVLRQLKIRRWGSEFELTPEFTSQVHATVLRLADRAVRVAFEECRKDLVEELTKEKIAAAVEAQFEHEVVQQVRAKIKGRLEQVLGKELG